MNDKVNEITNIIAGDNSSESSSSESSLAATNKANENKEFFELA